MKTIDIVLLLEETNNISHKFWPLHIIVKHTQTQTSPRLTNPCVFCHETKWRVQSLCDAKHPNDPCLLVCVCVNKNTKVKLHTWQLCHTSIYIISIKGSSSYIAGTAFSNRSPECSPAHRSLLIPILPIT